MNSKYQKTFGPVDPLCKEGISLYDIIINGLSKDFQTKQIIDEAWRSGFEIDERLVKAVRNQFNFEMDRYFDNVR
jgi:hypothetical protein